MSDRGRSGLATLQLQRGEGILTIFHSSPPTEDGLVEIQPDPEQQQAHKDETTNAGHHHYHHHHHNLARIERGDPPLNISEWALGSSQLVWGRYTSSCCSAQAELLVWDTAGNMRRCLLTSGQQRQQRDRNTDVSSASRIAVTAGMFYCMFGLLGSYLL